MSLSPPRWNSWNFTSFEKYIIQKGRKMPKTKYGKYITSEIFKKETKNPNASVTSTRHLEDKWGGGHLSIDTIYVAHPHVMISQPHQHEFPQYLNFFSSNPGDAKDFDAEIEVSFGAEQEKHVIKR